MVDINKNPRLCVPNRRVENESVRLSSAKMTVLGQFKAFYMEKAVPEGWMVSQPLRGPASLGPRCPRLRPSPL